ncbi:MAG: hypothetical protein ACRED4_00045, partial [Brevundimonas sp.]
MNRHRRGRWTFKKHQLALTCGTVIVGLYGFSPMSAMACTPAGTAGNDTVDCSGAWLNYNSGAGDDIVTVTTNTQPFTPYFDLKTGAGADQISVLPGSADPQGWAINYVEAGAGDDVITLNSEDLITHNRVSGDQTGVNESGDDTIYAYKGRIFGIIGMGGSDTIVVDGAVIQPTQGNSEYAGQIFGDEYSYDLARRPTQGERDLIYLRNGSIGGVKAGAGNDLIELTGVDVEAVAISIFGGPPTLINANRLIDGEDGDDEINLLAGSVGAVNGGAGADTILLNGASVNIVDVDVSGVATPTGSGTVNAGDGDDTFTWMTGTLATSFDGGNGSDTATVTASAYDGTIQALEGGDDVSTADIWTDRLTLRG